MTNDLPLAAEFSPPTRADWMKLVDAAIKSALFERTLVGKTYDALRIEPIYERAADARPVTGRAPAAPWQIVQRIDHPDPAAANAQALNDLENGATGLSLVIARSNSSYGFGLEASEAAIGRALDGIHLDAGIALEIDSGAPTDAASLVAALVKRRSIPPAAVDIRFGFDPLASGPSGWKDGARRFAATVCELTDQGFSGPFAVADARLVHDAGGSEAQELAFALANGVAYLRALEAGGVALGPACRMISFRLVADADQFLTIAKFRALRKLWARVEDACGLTPQPTFIAAATAWRMMTRRDPHVNILRTTIAAFSASLGGADAVCVLPFTQALGLPDAFARRIARNTQLILLEESNLAKVADPAAGSGGLEDLTQKLCGAAWGLFQEIEAAGGAASALEQGLLQNRVAAVRAEREKAVAHRRDPLTGVSEFPDISEIRPAVLDPAPLGRPSAALKLAWPQIRLAEPFEALRDASDRMVAALGSRPKVFLANLGTLADFTARTTFAKNFFEAGGIEAIGNDGFAGHQNLLTAFSNSGARLACLCSADEVYAREAAEAASALSAAGAHVYLAGHPGEREQALRSAGVDAFIFAGCNALAMLEAAYRLIAADSGDAQGLP